MNYLVKVLLFLLLALSTEGALSATSCKSLFKEDHFALIEKIAQDNPLEVISLDQWRNNSGLVDSIVGPSTVTYKFFIKLSKILGLSEKSSVQRISKKWAQKLKRIGYEQLPGMEGEATPGLTGRDINWDAIYDLRFTYDENIRHAISKLTNQSESRFGKVQLVDVLVSTDGKSNSENLGGASLLGYLPGGRPVNVKLFSSSEYRGYELRTNSLEAVIDIVHKLVEGKDFGYSGEFYGIQRLNDKLIGVISELPPAGLPFQFGGSKYFTIETAKELINIAVALNESGYQVSNFDLRPYITKEGRALVYPTTLGSGATERYNIFRNERMAASLGEMGVEVDLKMMSKSLDRLGLAKAMGRAIDFLYSSIDASESSELKKLFDWIKEEHEFYYRELGRVALGRIDGSDKVSREELEAQETSNTFLPWERLLYLQMKREGISIPGKKLPFVRKDRFFNFENLEPGEVVSFMLTSHSKNRWKKSSEVPLNVKFVGELIKIEISDAFEESYHFSIKWRSDQGEKKSALVFSKKEIHMLAFYIFSRRELSSKIKALELMRKKKERGASPQEY